MTQTALYRHYDAEGRLLYVGISLSAVQRLAQHADKDWSADIRRVEIEMHPDRGTAEAAEKAAIKAESPIHNKTGWRGKRARKPSPLDWIDRSGLSRPEICERAGISHSMLSMIETGARRPGVETVMVLAREFGADPATLRPDLARIFRKGAA
jgi:hypothetical protein